MDGSTLLELPPSWDATTNTTTQPLQAIPTHFISKQSALGESDHESLAYSSKSSSPTNAISASATSASSTLSISTTQQNENIRSIDHYVALGCLHFNSSVANGETFANQFEWCELLQLPVELQSIIKDEAKRLLDARWIRLFMHQPASPRPLRSLVRVYVLPEDRGRRFIDRNSKSLKAALRRLLEHVDLSPGAWSGDPSEAEMRSFDPWADAQNVSLYYLFNKLPSPVPMPDKVKCRYTRAAMHDLLSSAAYSEWDQHGEQPLPGLRTRLYPYQARSASLMLQREASPSLQLDPRLEVRTSPNGERFYFGAREGSFLKEPRYYESNRGGILAETMGLGKTIICLAVILATKGHFPQIPAAYQPPPPVRSRVGSLSEMAVSILGRRSIPARTFLEQSEMNGDHDFTSLKQSLSRSATFYEIPPDIPRMNRNTKLPPPQQLVLCSGTIIVVPRNLLHQWESEIRKHVLGGGLKMLVVDSVPKRAAKKKNLFQSDEIIEFKSILPTPTELMEYDVILFTRNRFEQEIQDGADEHGRRVAAGVARVCNCPYIGTTRIPDCNCIDSQKVYESPLKKLHWLRIIIDEGHSFSSSVSNAVLIAKQIHAERRWIVSGTPAKNLVGVEVDISILDNDLDDATSLRDSAIEKRKIFNQDKETTNAAKALGSLASNFLMVRPWCDSGVEGKLDWEEYIYRHEHQYRKTFSGFSSCFLRILEGLVVKTRPEDVDKDIVLPPMRHRVVYLKPCWFDKMTTNLFIQVLRANAITSERADVDYLFHKNSAKARHSLIRNLRQSNFTWTGFRLADVISTLETSDKYLNKEDKNCSLADAQSLLESCRTVAELTKSEAWKALSKAHEVGLATEDWPTMVEEAFSLAYPTKPTMVGLTQLLDGQLHIDSNLLSKDPINGLDLVGQAARAKVIAMAEAEEEGGKSNENISSDSQMTKIGVPSSCVDSQQSLMSRRTSALTNKSTPIKSEKAQSAVASQESTASASPMRPKKRKLTVADETATLPAGSPLAKTRVVGTTSAKLTYLLDKVMQHQATEKILIFYDGDNAAFYIAQCLEMLYINHRIYARQLDNTRRSEYISLFNSDPDIRVLLIDVACGSYGLNLNAASIVLIVNPINRPGVEAQAIKRAHRIGQVREVLVETLVLENTIEHAVFEQAKEMSHAQHLEAKELEDDESITRIIQNAQIVPIEPGEKEGLNSFALLQNPQRVFGRPDRHKYHRYGFTEAKGAEKRKKKDTASSSRNGKKAKKSERDQDVVVLDASPMRTGLEAELPLLGPGPGPGPSSGHGQDGEGGLVPGVPSLFG